MRNVLELNINHTLARGHTLTRAGIEWHAPPAPVIDEGLKSDKGFGAGVFRDAVFFKVAAHACAVDDAGPITAPHHQRPRLTASYGPQRTQNVELSVANSIGIQRDGRFHRDHRKQ